MDTKVSQVKVFLPKINNKMTDLLKWVSPRSCQKSYCIFNLYKWYNYPK